MAANRTEQRQRLLLALSNAFLHCIMMKGLQILAGKCTDILVFNIFLYTCQLITIYFRPDAAKIRLPLGPPISSLSQGIRSSMDHKVSVNIFYFVSV